MCGIVGYIGTKQAAPIILDGLSRLEYRGYDSAGMAIYDGEKINITKSVGRLKILENLTHDGETMQGICGIGHTRWATHGVPSNVNAHPHFNSEGTITHHRELYPAQADADGKGLSVCLRDGYGSAGAPAGLL